MAVSGDASEIAVPENARVVAIVAIVVAIRGDDANLPSPPETGQSGNAA